MREQQFVSFLMNGHLFGLDILLVREIIRNVDYTPVEHAPDSVRGLLNLRGQIITVLDLGPIMGLPKRDSSDSTRCIILKTDEDIAPLREAGLITDELQTDAIGLLVDGISDVVAVEEGTIDSPPANANGVDSDYLNGVIKLEGRLLLVLALKPLVDQGIGAVAVEKA